MNKLRLAVLCDLVEEGWPSMDLVAEMLVHALRQRYGESVEVTKVRPAMKRRISGQSVVSGQEKDKKLNADRFLNRFWDYPRFVRRIKNDFDLFHVVDHSYAQLVHQLPAERTIVSCHDLDTFRCLLNPERESRSVLFKAMMRRTLNGLRKAEFVTCDSEATRDELLEHGLIAAERLAIVRNGVHPSCSAEPNAEADREADKLLTTEDAEDFAEARRRRAEGRGQRSTVVRSQKSDDSEGEERFALVSPHPTPLPEGEGTSVSLRANPRSMREGTLVGRPHPDPLPLAEGTGAWRAGTGEQRKRNIDLLHVGSTIQRKRIDLLLRIFARVKASFPLARLLRVGGEFTGAQEELANDLGVRDSIVVMPNLTREVLAAVYRRATLVLLPSEREGFGLPVVEAMACGTPVVVSDLPVLHEVGGDAAVYCPTDDVACWVEAITDLVSEAKGSPGTWDERRHRAMAQAAKFSWAEYAKTMVGIYREVLRGTLHGDSRVAVGDREFNGLAEKVARSS
jgi:glycosyltransferase involved in cell wall biosynthesis